MSINRRNFLALSGAAAAVAAVPSIKLFGQDAVPDTAPGYNPTTLAQVHGALSKINPNIIHNLSLAAQAFIKNPKQTSVPWLRHAQTLVFNDMNYVGGNKVTTSYIHDNRAAVLNKKLTASDINNLNYHAKLIGYKPPSGLFEQHMAKVTYTDRVNAVNAVTGVKPLATSNSTSVPYKSLYEAELMATTGSTNPNLITPDERLGGFGDCAILGVVGFFMADIGFWPLAIVCIVEAAWMC